MNEQYFTKIFNLFSDDIYRLAYSYTQNKADSEDITQRVFIKYLKNINKVNKIEDEIKRWLIITTINECKDLFRNIWKKRVTPITEEINNTTPSKEKINIDEIINKLPQNYRIIFHLYYFYGYSTKEISNITKIKEEAIRKRLSRGRKLLQLEKED